MNPEEFKEKQRFEFNESVAKFMFWQWIGTFSIIMYVLSLVFYAFTDLTFFLFGMIFLAITPIAEGMKMYRAYQAWWSR